ncbi:Uncharacterised protein [uncultured archaeon]|nr:Uncharacterised protein [uncultured archaeon]
MSTVETYRLNLGRSEIQPIRDYSDLSQLVDSVLITNVLSGDKNTKGRVIVGEKLVGFLISNNPPTLFGVRFKENSEGDHLISGEKYKKLNYTPERLVLCPDNFLKRNPGSINDIDKNYITSYNLKGIIDGL